MKKCINCGNREFSHSTEEVLYSDVALVEADVYLCKKCGERYEGFSRIEDLSRRIAHQLAKKEERLSAPEIRFLRTYLGYSSKDLAAFLAVTPETMSRWETAALQMSLSMERLLRFMALTDKPISDYGLDNAGTKDQTTKKPHFKQRSGSWSEA